jgi:glycosyltransferase involved in cell wall biosynthesis
MTPKVVVVMPTYNGVRFIETQLKSIHSQLGVTVEIWVRDDGSTDGTEEYVKQSSLIHNLVSDSKGHLGTTGSLLEILGRIGEVEFLAFADQDDIWEPSHLSKAIGHISKKEPSLYFPRYRIFFESQKIHPKIIDRATSISSSNSFVENPIIGCGIVINSASVSLMQKISFSTGTHLDWQLYFLHTCVGNVVQGHRIGVNYRIHDKNQVGFRDSWFNAEIFQVQKLLFRLRTARLDFVSIYEQLKLLPQPPKIGKAIEYFSEGNRNFFYRLSKFYRVPFHRSKRIHQVVFVILYIFFGF